MKLIYVVVLVICLVLPSLFYFWSVNLNGPSSMGKVALWLERMQSRSRSSARVRLDALTECSRRGKELATLPDMLMAQDRFLFNRHPPKYESIRNHLYLFDLHFYFKSLLVLGLMIFKFCGL